MTLARLMLVTNRHLSNRPVAEIVDAAVRGGVDFVQIREKDFDSVDLLNLVREVQAVVGDRALISVNGSADVAINLGVGLHLPEFDPLPPYIRSNLAHGALIGRSVHSIGHASGAEDSLDYLVAGHVFATSSKLGQTPLGLAGLQAMTSVATAPVLAIGGILPESVGAVIAAGSHGIAVMSGIYAATDPEIAARRYRQALDQAAMYNQTQEPSEIEIQVNGKPALVISGWTLSDFLASKELHERMVVIERNGTILRYPQYPKTIIEAGDVLEIVHFVGGGS